MPNTAFLKNMRLWPFLHLPAGVHLLVSCRERRWQWVPAPPGWLWGQFQRGLSGDHVLHRTPRDAHLCPFSDTSSSGGSDGCGIAAGPPSHCAPAPLRPCTEHLPALRPLCVRQDLFPRLSLRARILLNVSHLHSCPLVVLLLLKKRGALEIIFFKFLFFKDFI